MSIISIVSSSLYEREKVPQTIQVDAGTSTLNCGYDFVIDGGDDGFTKYIHMTDA